MVKPEFQQKVTKETKSGLRYLRGLLLKILPLSAFCALAHGAFTFGDSAFVGVSRASSGGGLDCSQAVAADDFVFSGASRGSAADSYSAVFEWLPYAGDETLITRATILRSTSADLSSPVDVLGSGDLSFDDLTYADAGDHAPGPQPNTTYYAALKLTFNNGCPAKWSITNQVVVGCLAVAPSSVTYDGDSITPTSFTITWDVPDPTAISKQTARWGIATGVYTHFADVAVDATSYDVTGLTALVPVFFVVDTNDGNGCTARSAEGSATPL